ncbi:hypothetical protein HID58_045140 [Brassica napus]|uniref:Uncharacterized protein n=1 Tax=Brassica napus TaxID=3708 RepID=A0ABQ8AST0_BRANA|nr:hypothetical protein HID58_045140 [Brassica napus]
MGILILVDASLHVKYLPGLEGPLPFELETGYVSVGESGDVELFYYFVKSERNPDKDPLMIWLTGGPGCSSICGFLFANGPLAFKGNEYNGTLPPLELTSFSWTKARDYGLWTTLSLYPIHFTLVEIHIPGRLFQELCNRFHLGYVLGNPAVRTNLEPNHRVSFAHRMGLISDELHESLERNCGGKFFNVDPSNAKCSNGLLAYHQCISEIYIEQILLPNCKVDYVLADISQTLPNIRTSRRRELKEFSRNDSSSLPPPSCFTYRYFLSAFWANDENVRRALGVKKGFGKWSRCNTQNIPYTYDIHNAIPYHVNNSPWIKSLNYSIVDDWRPWMMTSNQVAGYTRTYANKMTFATIKATNSKPFLSSLEFLLAELKMIVFDMCREEDTLLSIIQTNAHLCSKDGLMEWKLHQ